MYTDISYSVTLKLARLQGVGLVASVSRANRLLKQRNSSLHGLELMQFLLILLDLFISQR